MTDRAACTECAYLYQRKPECSNTKPPEPHRQCKTHRIHELAERLREAEAERDRLLSAGCGLYDQAMLWYGSEEWTTGDDWATKAWRLAKRTDNPSSQPTAQGREPDWMPVVGDMVYMNDMPQSPPVKVIEVRPGWRFLLDDGGDTTRDCHISNLEPVGGRALCHDCNRLMPTRHTCEPPEPEQPALDTSLMTEEGRRVWEAAPPAIEPAEQPAEVKCDRFCHYPGDFARCHSADGGDCWCRCHAKELGEKPAPPPIPPALPGAVQALRAEIVAALRKVSQSADGAFQRLADELERSRLRPPEQPDDSRPEPPDERE